MVRITAVLRGYFKTNTSGGRSVWVGQGVGVDSWDPNKRRCHLLPMLFLGCMHIIPEMHNSAIHHFQRRDWQICDSTVLCVCDGRYLKGLVPERIMREVFREANLI